MRHGLRAVLAAGPFVAAISAAGPVDPRASSWDARVEPVVAGAAAGRSVDAPSSPSGIPRILLWKPANVLSSSPETILAVLTALGEDAHLTANLHEFGADLNVHEVVWAFAGIFPNNHVFNDPEGLALDSFTFNGGLLVVEGGDCFNHDPETLGAYNIRPIFGLLDGPDGTRDIFHVTGINDFAGYHFQYIGPNRFTDDLVPFTSLGMFRNTANNDVVAAFHPEYGAGRSIACSFEVGHLIDVPSIAANTKFELLTKFLHYLRNDTPPVLFTNTTALAETLAAGDSTIATFQVSNPGTINEDLTYAIAEQPESPWLLTIPTGGVLEGNQVATIQTVLFAQSLAPGAYTASLLITANDLANPADTLAVSLQVIPPPDLLIDPDSLAFQVTAQGGTDEDSLTLHNVGGSTLSYTLAMDDGGAERAEFSSLNVSASGGNRYRGNVYRATESTPLKRIEHRANVSTSTTFEFFVYQGEDSVAVYTKVFSKVVSSGIGNGWIGSGPIDVPLASGEYYFIGAAWVGTVTYYADAGATPLPAPVPFGTCLGSSSGNVYPSPPTKFVSAAPFLNSQALELGETGEVAILDPLAGTLEPQQTTIVNLRATGENVSGLLPATLLVTSNDPTRFIQTTQPVPITVVVAGGTGVPLAQLPAPLALHQNAPNPFRGSTTIRFDLAREEHVLLRVYDLAGRLVRTLVDTGGAPGAGQVVWDGRDGAGAQVTSGVYFYSLETPGETIRRKTILLR